MYKTLFTKTFDDSELLVGFVNQNHIYDIQAITLDTNSGQHFLFYWKQTEEDLSKERIADEEFRGYARN